MSSRSIKWERWIEPVNYEENSQGEENGKPFMVMKTDYGFVGMKMHGGINNDLKFLVGHTNFDIGPEEKFIIENTPGVEMWVLFSPYRFRFAAGKRFKEKDVRKRLTANLCGRNLVKLSPDIKKTLIDLKGQDGMYWLVYIMSPQKFESFSTKDVNSFNDVLAKYTKSRDQIGGRIIKGYKEMEWNKL